MHQTALERNILGRSLIVAGLVVFACSSSIGQTQTIEMELAQLRRILDVPSSVNIRPSPARLPNRDHLKVFVTTGGDQKGYELFVNKIGEWNRVNGTRYKMVEVTSDFWQADVVLARYDDSLDKNPISGTMPLYLVRSHAYILSRNSEGLEMVWRNVSEAYLDKTRSGEFGDTLRREFFKRLKNKN